MNVLEVIIKKRKTILNVDQISIAETRKKAMLVSQQNCNKALLQELPFYEDDKIHHNTCNTYHAKTT